MVTSLRYRKVRQLTLDRDAHPSGRAFLSAASGLVRVGERLYVVADDELHLGAFDVGSRTPLRLVRMLDGALPAGAKKRKKKKPDLESLLVLPGDRDHPGGALLALGSGSRPNRFVGALLRLDERGDTAGAARAVDLAPLYRTFESRLEELNVEGAFVGGDSLALLQRGSGRHGARASAVVRFELAPTLAWLAGRRRAPSPRSVRRLDLGAAEGVAFAFTDGAALPDGRWVFSAVAEARDNAFDDGPCVASAIGVCGGDDKLRFMATIAPRRKVEGIEAMHVGARLRLSVVTDADDPEEPAELGAVSLAPGNGAAPLRAAPSARTRT